MSRYLSGVFLMVCLFISNLVIGQTDTTNKVSCDHLVRHVDDFTDKVAIFNSPSGFLGDGYVSGKEPYFYKTFLVKNIQNGKSKFYLKLSTNHSSVDAGETGVIVLFTDGSRFTKPKAEIDVEASENGYEYSCYLLLSTSEVDLFCNKIIKKYRLYIYDEEIDLEHAMKFAQYANCVKIAK